MKPFLLLQARYSRNGTANFEGKWHLHTFSDMVETAAALGLPEAETEVKLAAARGKLFQAREQRVRPGRDEKILGSWNALMIKGMARAARVLGREEYLKSAGCAREFIRSTLWCEGRLLATYKDGKAHLPAYLDDYAFLLDALLELLQTRWSSDDLHFATALADALLEHFRDPGGGFFFTADDHEELIQRPKSLGDESTPSGNGVAAHALLRLGHMLGEPRYLDAAEHTLRRAWPQVSRLPYAHGTLLKALDEWLKPAETLVVRAPQQELERRRQRLSSRSAARRFTLWIPNEAAGLPGLLAERKPKGTAIAYLCSGTQCKAPVSDPQELERLISGVAES